MGNVVTISFYANMPGGLTCVSNSGKYKAYDINTAAGET